jgi:two-component system phosphate regulon sensor histidine kinase PhoR
VVERPAFALASAGLDAVGLLQGIPDPVILIDRRRRIVAMNTAARDLFPLAAVDRDLAQGIRHPGVLRTVDAVLAQHERRITEVDLIGQVPRSFELHAAPLQGEAKPDGVAAVAVFHDLTLVRRAEEMRADFVANVSHELRSPLTSLAGMIETLRGPARNDEAARDRFLLLMQGEALRMTRLINDLLSLSRVEINEHIQPNELVDIRTILHTVTELLAPQIAAKSMKVEFSAADPLPPVPGDRDQLFQVFQNILENAVKYGAAGTAIDVAMQSVPRMTESGRPGVLVSIADQGEGIAREHIPRLTERFYRVDRGRSRDMGGTGLGLAIVKHIVNRHRGQLVIESEPGKGSRFSVILPRSAGSGESRPNQPA